MLNNLASFIPHFILFSHFALLVLILSLVFRKSWGSTVYNLIASRALVIAFAVSIAAVAGSLFYSEVMGFEPCVLCWWQRVFLYPLVAVFGVALWKKLGDAFLYAVPLAVLAGLVSLYQAYGPLLGTESLLPCLADEGECAKVYVKAFGYITIPIMSLTISLFILFFAWADKISRNENSNA